MRVDHLVDGGIDPLRDATNKEWECQLVSVSIGSEKTLVRLRSHQVYQAIANSVSQLVLNAFCSTHLRDFPKMLQISCRGSHYEVIVPSFLDKKTAKVDNTSPSRGSASNMAPKPNPRSFAAPPSTPTYSKRPPDGTGTQSQHTHSASRRPSHRSGPSISRR